MDNLNTIPNSGSFGDVSAKLNDNFSKVGQSLTTLENVAIANKGYFDTLASLQAAFPSPKAGNIAYVANVASSTGYYIYNVVAGVWTATTTEAPAVGVAISDYAQHGYSSSPKTLKQVDDEVVQLAGPANAVRDLLYTEKRRSTTGGPITFYGLVSGIHSSENGLVVQKSTTSYLRTNFNSGILISKPAKLIMPNSYYAFRAICADDTSGSMVVVHETNWTAGGNEIILPTKGYNKVYVNFRYASGAATMNQNDIDAIQNAFDIYYFKPKQDVYTGKTSMHFECGRLSSSVHKVHDDSFFETTFVKYIRTPKLFNVSGIEAINLSIPSLDGVDIVCRIGLFDYNYVNIAWETILLDTPIDINRNASYMNIEIEFIDDSSIPYDGIPVYITYTSTYKAQHQRVIKGMSVITYADGSSRNCHLIKGSYNVNSSGPVLVENEYKDYTASLIRFPRNYNPIGDPVPLIVYFHSTSDYNNIMQDRISFESFRPYIDYLVNEGYAVLDTHAYGHLYSKTGNGYRVVTGSQMNVNAYLSSIARALDVYNIDRSRVYGLGYSAGGYTGLQMAWKGVKLFNAIAQFAPAVSASRYLGGRSENKRIDFCESAGFVGDYSVLASEGVSNKDADGTPSLTQELIEFFTQNADKFRQSNPFMIGTVNQSLEDMIERALQPSVEQPGAYGGGERQSSAYSGISKVAHVPIKIWQAIDDDNVPYEWVKAFVDQLRNGGSVIDFRIIPAGHGGHYSFYETTERISGTTVLGIPYENIPFPWVEAVRYFRKYQ